MEQSGNSTSRARYYLRVLRPLFYWLVFVLVLFGIKTHQRLMERTRLYFDLTMGGKQERFSLSVFEQGNPFGATAAFDGQPVSSGTKIPLGFHTFTITGPKTVPFSTNLFVWYGGRDFGAIDLKRAQGTLVITADPPAPLLFIQGPEFGTTLTNVHVSTIKVPTDQYEITAQYPHSRWQQQAQVSNGALAPLNIAPRFGLLNLTCNQNGATYELSALNGNLVQTGELPASIAELPEGRYNLVSWHHNHKWTEPLAVRAGITNDVPVGFQYGTAILETTPPGATVVDGNGTQLGVTPLTITELQPGTWQFNLQLYNYEPAGVALSIAVNQTNAFRTNLISESYASAMRAARQFMNDGKYDDATQSLIEALREQPGDQAATALQKQAVGLGCIDRAETIGKQGDYINGIKELDSALGALPDNEHAKELLANFKQHEPEQRARQERERSEALTNVFNAFNDIMIGAASVETREIRTSKSAKEIQAAIVERFHSVAPAFNLSHVGWTNEVFYMGADQEVSGGGRQCMIVGGQIKDDETRILFKVVEFKSEAVGLKILGAVVAAATSTKYQSGFHPINPSDTKISDSDKTRVSEGTRIVTERIERAIGQTPLSN